jgi:multiple sugar transport system ATP-binding protein
MARVRLENLFKIFKGPKGQDIYAVNNANLVIEDKEFLVLVGPSGCGKSTTLRLIAGLEEITLGTISIEAKVVNDVPPKDRDIAMVFQNYALYPHMTVYDNMAFGLKLRKYPGTEIDQRVKNASEILGLMPNLHSLPKTLSGGERQRVAVGRAVVRKPKVFLFDEPLSNLDAKMRVQMRTEIRKLQTRLAATMIYVTHDQVEAMTMGDRIAVMKDGVIHQVTEPMNLYDHPINMFVAGFIGSPPMNFFHGVIAQKGNALYFQEQNSGGAAPGNFTVQLDDDTSPKLTSYTGKEIVFGIRPENIADTTNAGSGPTGQTVQASAEVVEPTGSEAYLYLSSGSHSFVARVHANNRVSVKQKVSLVFDMRKAHFFDPATEKAII